jgi:hypothetical protein
MQIKSFTARSTKEVLSMIKAELGLDAVILDTQEEDGLITMTAALERATTHRTPSDAGNGRGTAPFAEQAGFFAEQGAARHDRAQAGSIGDRAETPARRGPRGRTATCPMQIQRPRHRNPPRFLRPPALPLRRLFRGRPPPLPRRPDPQGRALRLPCGTMFTGRPPRFPRGTMPRVRASGLPRGAAPGRMPMPARRPACRSRRADGSGRKNGTTSSSS